MFAADSLYFCSYPCSWCVFQNLLACAKDIAGAGPMGFFKVSNTSLFLLVVVLSHLRTSSCLVSSLWLFLRSTYYVSICKTNSLFTPPTQTRQDKTVLSCLRRRCEHYWRQDKTVLPCLNPVSNFQLFSLKYIDDYWKLGNWKLDGDQTKLIETGFETRQNCLVLSAVVSTPPTRTRQDSLVLSALAVWTSYNTSHWWCLFCISCKDWLVTKTEVTTLWRDRNVCIIIIIIWCCLTQSWSTVYNSKATSND